MPAKNRNTIECCTHWTRNGQDENGRWYWFEEDKPDVIHGPFATKAESIDHQRVTLLGPHSEAEPTEKQLQ